MRHYPSSLLDPLFNFLDISTLLPKKLKQLYRFSLSFYIRQYYIWHATRLWRQKANVLKTWSILPWLVFRFIERFATKQFQDQISTTCRQPAGSWSQQSFKLIQNWKCVDRVRGSSQITTLILTLSTIRWFSASCRDPAHSQKETALFFLVSLKGQPRLHETFFFVDSPDDAEKYLPLPRPSVSGDISSFFAANAEVGEKGIVDVGVLDSIPVASSPNCVVQRTSR